jgi:hypothetical protein
MYFSEVEYPRKGPNVLYPLEEILLIAIVTFLMRCEGFEDMEDVGCFASDGIGDPVGSGSCVDLGSDSSVRCTGGYG